MSDVTVPVLDPSVELRLHRLTGAFLAGYRNANTRTAELYLRWFERQVGSINAVCHGLSVLASFYRWMVETGQLDTTPIAAVRRPSRDETPRQTRLPKPTILPSPHARAGEGHGRIHLAGEPPQRERARAV